MRGDTVRQFADRIGKTPGYVSRMEVRGEIPSPELLCEIAEIHKVRPEELLQLAKQSQLEKVEKLIDGKQASALSLHRKENK